MSTAAACPDSTTTMPNANSPTTAAIFAIPEPSFRWPLLPDRTVTRKRKIGRDAPDHDLARVHERRERFQRVAHARERGVAVEALARDRRRLAVGEPRLEVHVTRFQPGLGPIRLRVDRADEAT